VGSHFAFARVSLFIHATRDLSTKSSSLPQALLDLPAAQHNTKTTKRDGCKKETKLSTKVSILQTEEVFSCHWPE
jgi:hypothetical protein